MFFLSWPEVHGALTHMPVAFLLAVPVFEIAAALRYKAERRNMELRVVSFWLVVAAVVTAVPSLLSGYITARTLFPDGHVPPQFQSHWIAAVLTAVLALVLLVFRLQTREQAARPEAARPEAAERALPIAIGFSLLIAALVGYTGYLGGKMVFGDETADATETTEPVPVDDAKTKDVKPVDARLAATGKKLFAQYRCQACHRIDGKGATTGPDLTQVGRRRPGIDWNIAHLKDPEKLVPGSSMPPFSDLSEAELQALANYVASLK